MAMLRRIIHHGGRRATSNAIEALERRTLLSINPLDPAFGGGDGIVSHPDAGVVVWPAATTVQSDGKLVAVGYQWAKEEMKKN